MDVGPQATGPAEGTRVLPIRRATQSNGFPLGAGRGQREDFRLGRKHLHQTCFLDPSRSALQGWPPANEPDMSVAGAPQSPGRPFAKPVARTRGVGPARLGRGRWLARALWTVTSRTASTLI